MSLRPRLREHHRRLPRHRRVDVAALAIVRHHRPAAHDERARRHACRSRSRIDRRVPIARFDESIRGELRDEPRVAIGRSLVGEGLRGERSTPQIAVVRSRRLRRRSARFHALLPPQHPGSRRRETSRRFPSRRDVKRHERVGVAEGVSERGAEFRRRAARRGTRVPGVRRARVRTPPARHRAVSTQRPTVRGGEILARRERGGELVVRGELRGAKRRPPTSRGKRKVRTGTVRRRVQRQDRAFAHPRQHGFERRARGRDGRVRGGGGDEARDGGDAGDGGGLGRARRSAGVGIRAEARLARRAHHAENARESEGGDETDVGVRATHGGVLGGAVEAPASGPGSVGERDRGFVAAETVGDVAMEQGDHADAHGALDGVGGRAEVSLVVADDQRGGGRSTRADTRGGGATGRAARATTAAETPRREKARRRSRRDRRGRHRGRRRRPPSGRRTGGGSEGDDGRDRGV